MTPAVVERVQRAVDPNRETKLGLVSRAIWRYLADGMIDRAPTPALASAGQIILLLWIWLAATALLYGAELDQVLEARVEGRRRRRADRV